MSNPEGITGVPPEVANAALPNPKDLTQAVGTPPNPATLGRSRVLGAASKGRDRGITASIEKAAPPLLDTKDREARLEGFLDAVSDEAPAFQDIAELIDSIKELPQSQKALEAVLDQLNIYYPSLVAQVREAYIKSILTTFLNQRALMDPQTTSREETTRMHYVLERKLRKDPDTKLSNESLAKGYTTDPKAAKKTKATTIKKDIDRLTNSDYLIAFEPQKARLPTVATTKLKTLLANPTTAASLEGVSPQIIAKNINDSLPQGETHISADTVSHFLSQARAAGVEYAPSSLQNTKNKNALAISLLDPNNAGKTFSTLAEELDIPYGSLVELCRDYDQIFRKRAGRDDPSKKPLTAEQKFKIFKALTEGGVDIEEIAENLERYID